MGRRFTTALAALALAMTGCGTVGIGQPSTDQSATSDADFTITRNGFRGGRGGFGHGFGRGGFGHGFGRGFHRGFGRGFHRGFGRHHGFHHHGRWGRGGWGGWGGWGRGGWGGWGGWGGFGYPYYGSFGYPFYGGFSYPITYPVTYPVAYPVPVGVPTTYGGLGYETDGFAGYSGFQSAPTLQQQIQIQQGQAGAQPAPLYEAPPPGVALSQQQEQAQGLVGY